MISKRRILKYLLFAFTLLALGSLWAFGQFFFYPWEGRYEGDVASLIPRDVDFYLAKGELREDFDPFPKPVFVDRLFASESGKALQAHPEYRELLAGLDLEARLAELDAALEQVPVELDPLGIVAGRDVAIAGRFRGRTLDTAAWAVYARISWLGKLGFGVVDNGLGLDAQGLKTEPIRDEAGDRVGLTLSGGQLTTPLHLARVDDVVIIASEPEFILQSRGLVVQKGADSLLQSAKYFDHIGQRELEGDELEVYLDYRALAESQGLSGAWPDPHARELWPAFAGKLFQLACIRELAGTLSFGTNLRLDLTADLSSNVLTPTQKTLYRERGFEREDMLDVAQWVPADAGLLVYGHADLGVLLREAVASMDPDTLALVEDKVREIWGYADVYPLIDDLTNGLRDRFAFCMRNYDYPFDPEGPTPDGEPVPAWALILWVEDKGEVQKISDRIQSHQRELGIQGREPGSPGVFTITRHGTIREFWSPFIKGTGQIATLEDTGRSLHLIISNENRMLDGMFSTYHTGGSAFPRLSESLAYRTWVGAGLPNANLLAWWNPGAMGETLRKLAAREAEKSLLDAIDWSVERPRIEREVLRGDFPGMTVQALGEADRQRYEAAVQAELDAFQAEFERKNTDALRADAELGVELLELTDGTLLQLALDQKQFKLHGRIGLSFLQGAGGR